MPGKGIKTENIAFDGFDSIAKSISDLRLEYAAISTQLSRHERWIKEIAEKVGLKLVTD